MENQKEGFMIIRAAAFDKAIEILRRETKDNMKLLFYDVVDWKYNINPQVFFKYEEYL